MNNLIKTITKIKYDKKSLVIYSGISIFIYYILEKIEFRKIGLFLLVFLGVFIYFKNDSLFSNVGNVNSKKNNVQNTSPTNNIKNDNQVNIENTLDNFKIKNPNFINKAYKINELETLIKKLNDFIKINYKEVIVTYGETSKRNYNIDLYQNIKRKTRDYLNQIEVILSNEYYLDKSFHKLIAIKKDILRLLHSMFFKINNLYDSKINEFMTQLNCIFINIEQNLKKQINQDFINNPNSYKGILPSNEGDPEEYDPHESLNDITITNNMIKF